MTLEDAINRYPIIKFFDFQHLPEPLKQTSAAFLPLALDMAAVPGNAETAAGLRKLLEAKDCAVRAKLAEQKGQP